MFLNIVNLEPAGPEEISALGLLVAFAAIFFTMRLALRMRRPTPAEARLVLAGIAAGEAEARLWSGALETRGIRATVRTLGGGVMPMLTDYELWVDADDRERARELLGLTAAAAPL